MERREGAWCRLVVEMARSCQLLRKGIRRREVHTVAMTEASAAARTKIDECMMNDAQLLMSSIDARLLLIGPIDMQVICVQRNRCS